jgi:sulfur-carrier protein adenylyltransferase/sulfurtransferase
MVQHSDVCAIYNLPWIYSAILAFEGQVSVFNFHSTTNSSEQFHGPDYRDLLPIPPLPGDVPSCAEGGVIGVLPGTMGCIQATEAIKYIIGHHDGLLVGRILRFDALMMKFTEIGVKRASDRLPITELIDYQGFCGGPKTTNPMTTSSQMATSTSNQTAEVLPNAANGGRTMDEAESVDTNVNPADIIVCEISPKECYSKLMGGWTPYVIDVRLESEHDIVRLPFTDCVVPHREIKLSNIPTQDDVLIYCKGGVRGRKACTALIDAGIDSKRLYNLKGGIMQWQSDIDLSMPRY